MPWNLITNIQGADGVGGGGGVAAPQVFVQQVDPETTNPEYTGPAIWYQLDAGGNVIGKKIRDGVAFDGLGRSVLTETEGPFGITTLPRIDSGVYLYDYDNVVSGELLLTFVYPNVTRVIDTIQIPIGAAAGATPTICRLGIYSVAGDSSLTLIGSTPNDTALFSTGYANVSKALSASVTLTAGETYAFGVLFVTAASPPNLRGRVVAASAAGLAPRLCGRFTAQTNLPATVNSWDVWDCSVAVYMRGHEA